MNIFFKENKFLMTFIFILALLPRIASAVFSGQLLLGDEIDYSQLAVRILEGKPYHSNFLLGFANARPPIYPLFIAIIYLFTNQSILAVKLIQALLGVLTCVVVFFIAEDIFKDKRISFGTGLICALYPFLIFLSSSLMSECLFTFLLVLAILFLLKVYAHPNLKNKFFSGLFLGLTALTKPAILAFAPFLFLWFILFSYGNALSRTKNIIIVVSFMGLTIIPWTIRNYIVFKEFIPISTGGGLTFYIYNNENTLTKIFDPVIFLSVTPLSDEQKKAMSLLSEPKKDKYLYRLGWKFARSHPKDFFKIRLISLSQFWHLWPETPARYKAYYQKEGVFRNSLLDKFVDTYLLYFVKILYHLIYDIFFIGIFLSLVSSVKKGAEFRKSFLLILLLVSMSLLYSIHGTDRYRIPTDPYVFLLGFHGVLSLWMKK